MGRTHALKPPRSYFPPPPSPAGSSPLEFLKNSYAASATLIHSTTSLPAKIPGYRTSAAFLTNLHSNLYVEYSSSCESLVSPSEPVPTESPSNHFGTDYEHIRTASPLIYNMSAQDPDFAPPAALSLPIVASSDPETSEQEVDPELGPDGIPLLRTFLASTDTQYVAALKLVADSVAQQRNLASRSMIYHPLTIAFFVVGFAVIRQLLYKGDIFDYVKIFTTFTGFVMAVLVYFRYACKLYLDEAERVGTWRWLDEGRNAKEDAEASVKVLGKQDEVLLTKFGPEYIGAIIFRGIQRSPSTTSTSKKPKKSDVTTSMQIRAWTVAQKYRRKDVGSALMEEAIRIGTEKGWTQGGIEIAEDHANSKRVLTPMFNGPLDRFSEIAAKVLERKEAEIEGRGGKKGKKK